LFVSEFFRNRLAEAGFRTAAKEIKNIDNERAALALWDEYATSGQFYDIIEGKFFHAPTQLKPHQDYVQKYRL